VLDEKLDTGSVAEFGGNHKCGAVAIVGGETPGLDKGAVLEDRDQPRAECKRDDACTVA